MLNGTFEVQEQDIVRLDVGTFGWVNIGAHAVKISADEEGNLQVDCHPRGNEGSPVYSIQVNDATVRQYGGVNPDEEPEPVREAGDESTLGVDANSEKD